ncbi:hypothetical protein FC81_GL001193 [Liquorilactobacillus capillatus DSM 19910]|uniref:HTH cro/C1-type domain-containing protein n=2 Tax=Liquorilactobacillus capillatus TaxID=480931 RepID=A0A0R1M0G8_9LACO|nr:hypothetical protein FC81_GL001193 [Liquorilactobacillus capillatus DSM 19910]
MKSLRVQNNFTQEEIAQKLFVSRKTISSWENGRSYPDIKTLIKISDIYQITLDQLLREDELMLKQYNDGFQANQRNNRIFHYSYLLNIIFLFLSYAAFVWTIEPPYIGMIKIAFIAIFITLCVHLPISLKTFLTHITWKQVAILIFIGIVTFGLNALKAFPIVYSQVGNVKGFVVGYWAGYIIEAAFQTFSLWLAIFLMPVLNDRVERPTKDKLNG